MITVAVALTAVFVALTAVRVGLAAVALRAEASAPVRAAGSTVHTARAQGRGVVTVLQAIRSGDPLMPGMLAENLAHSPHAHFVWLVDADDPTALAVTERLAATAPGRVDVVVTPPLVPGHNPKVAKFAAATPGTGDVLAVLDDDTVLPPGALDEACDWLDRADLVTGIPLYREQGTVWSRLVAAFVNGSSLLTYLPLARVQPPVTINGMFYVTRRDVLDSLGGFAAIGDRLCDDYAIARLYRRHGHTVAQTAIAHPLATTVPDARAYARIMRRWLVFGTQVVRGDASLAMLGLVVLPAALPLVVAAAGLLAGVTSGTWGVPAAAAAALLGKAGATAALRRRTGVIPVGPAGILLEVVADVLLPVQLVAATVGPARVEWRGRSLDVDARGLAAPGPAKQVAR